jgi:deoxycytidylate deaminase
MLIAVTRALGSVQSSDPDETALKLAKEKLRETGLFDLTEFGRAVHAEMAALLSCARVGVSCRDAVLFTTTFPCHNCTKHLVAAGISEVVFVEPYPKSKALELHGDAVTIAETGDKKESRVVFRPFVGIGPRRFMDLFSLKLGSGREIERREQNTGSAVEFHRADAIPRMPMQPNRYFERETITLSMLDVDIADSEGDHEDGEKGQEFV